MEGSLTPASAPLVDLCHVLGISTSDLAAVEGADVLTHTFSVRSADAARLDPAGVRAFVEHYGDAGRIELRTGDLTELVIQAGVDSSEVSAFAEQASSGGPYEATVHVDKTRLAEHLASSPVRTVRVFLFAESLRRLLARGITRFEADVWPEAPAPLVVVVLDTNVRLAGPHLTVLGGSSLNEVGDYASVPRSDVGFDAILENRDRHIGWDSPWVRALTPWHFDVRGACDDPLLHALLRSQLVKLSVLFTCDRARARQSHIPPGEILAEYRGREHIAIVPIDESQPIDGTDVEIDAVLRAVDWCYERHGAQGQPNWVSDRLPFIQTRVAQSLEPHSIDQRLEAFTNSMPYLLEGIKWHWKAFIEGKVGEYLDRVEQVETLVGDTVAGFADRTASLSKKLTDNILAAVVVLIGSFIAAAFRTPFNATLFRIAVLTYAGYVLLFPGAVGLIASATNLRSAREEFNTRILQFKETLHPEKVDEIVGMRVLRAQATFWRWLGFVAAAYLVLVIAAGMAASRVPDFIRGDSVDRPEAPLISPAGNTSSNWEQSLGLCPQLLGSSQLTAKDLFHR